MKTVDLFRETLKLHIEKSPWGEQTRIAENTGIGKHHLNDFLKGRKLISEERREAIAKFLGYSYLDFLNIGKKALLDAGIKPDDEDISIECTECIRKKWLENGDERIDPKRKIEVMALDYIQAATEAADAIKAVLEKHHMNLKNDNMSLVVTLLYQHMDKKTKSPGR